MISRAAALLVSELPFGSLIETSCTYCYYPIQKGEQVYTSQRFGIIHASCVAQPTCRRCGCPSGHGHDVCIACRAQDGDAFALRLLAMKALRRNTEDE